LTTSKFIAKSEPKGMTYAEIDARLRQLGWTFNPNDETFEQAGKRLAWGKVLKAFPEASEDLLASYAEDRMWKSVKAEASKGKMNRSNQAKR
jgi:hypothetical protein